MVWYGTDGSGSDRRYLLIKNEGKKANGVQRAEVVRLMKIIYIYFLLLLLLLLLLGVVLTSSLTILTVVVQAVSL